MKLQSLSIRFGVEKLFVRIGVRTKDLVRHIDVSQGVDATHFPPMGRIVPKRSRTKVWATRVLLQKVDNFQEELGFAVEYLVFGIGKPHTVVQKNIPLLHRGHDVRAKLGINIRRLFEKEFEEARSCVDVAKRCTTTSHVPVEDVEKVFEQLTKMSGVVVEVFSIFALDEAGKRSLGFRRWISR